MPRVDLLILIAVVLVAAFLLAGCDDYERELAQADSLERFMNGCMPKRPEQNLPPDERTHESVIVKWEDVGLVCRRITVSSRYGRTFPHTEIRVVTIEGL
jgi:hypothetical protein